MRLITNVPRSALAAAGVALLLGGGGVAALAAIPGANGVIHACYSRSTGVLRVINSDGHSSRTRHCAGNEASLAFNQKGPKGARGPQGPQGDTGPSGTQGDPGAGPSTGPTIYSAHSSGVSVPNAYTQVLSVTLPPGSYALQAKLQFNNPVINGVEARGNCLLRDYPTTYDFASVDFRDDSTGGPLTLQATVSEFPGGTVTVDCQAVKSGSLTVDFTNATLTAITAAALNP